MTVQILLLGGAIGRIDVGDRNGSNTYGRAGDRYAVITIENFTYEQGATPLVFLEGLKNIRYGGVVANITRGGKLIMVNCRAVHNARVYKPTANLYCAGLIGCNKADYNMGIYLSSDSYVGGVIDNQAVSYYNGSFQIEKYVGNKTSFIVMVPNPQTGAASSRTCTNTLSVTGLKTGFKTSDQTF